MQNQIAFFEGVIQSEKKVDIHFLKRLVTFPDRIFSIQIVQPWAIYFYLVDQKQNGFHNCKCDIDCNQNKSHCLHRCPHYFEDDINAHQVPESCLLIILGTIFGEHFASFFLLQVCKC